MSAELRRAAALIRARSDAANEGPWSVRRSYSGHYDILAGGFELGGDFVSGDAAHIASWHPEVAFTVADWLDLAARYAPPDPHHEGQRCETCENVTAALAVARAYLGETS